ncbi:hypothetical protein FSP39_006615 [Pinctada imbricata]|uniref:DDE Tnp4 domain-containing protein n=1 Tax=Pinctada imbricata TaxID=66713 RepID=A0AA89C322_PINIB|nr:hypothetical protein FSP39_006615 [Pinctada imbricata]
MPTLQSINALAKALHPKANRVKYWRGPTFQCNRLRHKVFRKQRNHRNLSMKEEILITLMKIRLCLLDEDLANRFDISVSNVSRIFTTWVKILGRFLEEFVFNPPKEVVRSNLPPKFKTQQYSKVRHIIDCSEVFIEKPQSMMEQNQCWSDYKHHYTNTEKESKFLVSITPAGMINFVSNCWGGRVSDKCMTLKSGFLDIIEPYDAIMADKGFSSLIEEVTLLRVHLLVPPGRHGMAQMTSCDVQKTKDIANRRIYVEQAIRRIHFFRMLKFEVPVTICQHLDDVLRIVCGICNLYPPLPRYDVM